MQIKVSGANIDIGLSIQEYACAELEGAVTKYFENAISADIVFSKVRHLFRTDIIVNEGTGANTLIKASSEDDDIYASFDLCATKIEKQLRRYKRRIKNHHKPKLGDTEIISGMKYILPSNFEDNIENQDEHDSANENISPLIIAEKATNIERLTVRDAVMRMDLSNLPALMFINKRTGSYNIVYKREDGNISWVDSSNNSENVA